MDVDAGGTLTDLLLVNEKTGQTWKAMVSSYGVVIKAYGKADRAATEAPRAKLRAERK